MNFEDFRKIEQSIFDQAIEDIGAPKKFQLEGDTFSICFYENKEFDFKISTRPHIDGVKEVSIEFNSDMTDLILGSFYLLCAVYTNLERVGMPDHVLTALKDKIMKMNDFLVEDGKL